MIDMIKNLPYGKAALKKMAAAEPLPDDFMLYEAGFVQDKPEIGVMFVKGAVFREAKRGPNKGLKCIPVAGTARMEYVSRQDCREFELQDDGDIE